MLGSSLRRLLGIGVVLASLLAIATPVGASTGSPQSARAAQIQADELSALAGRTAAAAEQGASTAAAAATQVGARTAATAAGGAPNKPQGIDPNQDGSVNYPAYDSDYHNYPEMVAHVDAIAAANPTFVKEFSIGDSYQGRPLVAAEISNNLAADQGRPEIFFDGLHHAREHLSAETTIFIFDMLVNNYNMNTPLGTRVTNIINTKVVWIVFMVNPDGLQYDISGPANNPYRSWRKNRQPGPGGIMGTDINRNYGYRWGCCNGSSGNPGSDTYRGPAAWSAPEARAIRDFVLSRDINGVQEIKVHITFHTAGKQILWPYGYTSQTAPKDMTAVDHRVFVTMGHAMAATNGYTPMQSNGLYPTDGDQIDWMYGAERIFSYTFEMYPGPGDVYTGQRWYPPESMLATLLPVNQEAVLYLMQHAACPYSSIGKASAYCGPFYDDLEMNRDWTMNPAHTDTATQGAWARGVPVVKPYQLAANDGLGALVTGLKGYDVDGGNTSVRSRMIQLGASGNTLRLRYWVGFDTRATASDSFVVRLVDGSGATVATALTIRGNGTVHKPAWRTLSFSIPSALDNTTVAIELVATDAGADATIEAGVDTVRITAP